LGRVYVVDGTLRGEVEYGDADWSLGRLYGSGESFGGDVTVAGDLDGDGQDDLVVDGDERSFVFYGPVIEFGNEFDSDLRLDWGRFVDSVEPAGDVGGDGLPDLIGTTGYGARVFSASTPRSLGATDAASSYSCDVYVKRGQGIGDADADGTPDLAFDTVDLSPDSAQNHNLWIVPAEAEGVWDCARAGTFVPMGRAGAGDVRVVDLDEDGVTEVAVAYWTIDELRGAVVLTQDFIWGD
jgi:hypothetical protein